MFSPGTFAQLTVALAIALITGGANMSHSEPKGGVESSNQMLGQASFERWRAGTGGPFELLADDARWTITGSSPVSNTYQSKDQFMTEVIRPFNARMD